MIRPSPIRVASQALAASAPDRARLWLLAVGWALLIVAGSAVRAETSSLAGTPAPSTLVAWLALAAAPIGSMAMAARWFGRNGEPVVGHQLDSGRYRPINLRQARRHPRYGPSGLMASLLAGLLITIVLRAGEYFAAMPALSGPTPSWLSSLHLVLTIDVVLFTSAYAVAFIAALKKAPLFPALLAAIWGADLAMQLGIAEAVARQPDLPAAVGDALHHLLQGNVAKVLVSIGLWLPYLLLSTRVNVTYRHRLPR